MLTESSSQMLIKLLILISACYMKNTLTILPHLFLEPTEVKKPAQYCPANK